MNPYALDAPVVKPFTDEGVAKALSDWAADQRERQAWDDNDRQVYKHRADLLEAAAERLHAAADRIAELEAEVERMRPWYPRAYAEQLPRFETTER